MSIRPSLLLDFAAARFADPRITFTRASTGTCFDALGRLVTVAANQPRFDFDPATGLCLGLLIEESRTNLLLHSEDITNAAWIKNGVNTGEGANSGVAPDGTATADSILEGAVSSEHFIAQTATGGTGTYAWTVFAKQGAGTRSLRVRLADSNGFIASVFFNFATESLYNITAGATATVQKLPDGWYRICATASASGNNPFMGLYMVEAGQTPTTYQGDGTSSIYVWGMQIEAGSFPTSYIPTTTAAATRAAEEAMANSIGAFFNQTEGTFVIGGGSDYGASASLNATRYGVLSDGSNNSRIILYGHLLTLVESGVAENHASLASSNTNILGRRMRAWAYSSAGSAVAGAGELATLATAVAVPAVDRLSLGNNSPYTNGAGLNGHIARLAYFPKRLSNTDLQRLTA